MRQWQQFSSLGLVLMLALTGCGDDTGGGGGNGGGNGNTFTIGENPEIRVEFNGYEIGQGDTVNVPATGAVGVEAQAGTLYISNPDGNAALLVTEVVINSNPAGLFRLEAEDAGAMPSAGTPWSVANPGTEGEQTRVVKLFFTRPEDIQGVSGSLIVKSNTTSPTERTLNFTVKVDDQVPEINVNPSVVDFGNVGQGDTKNQDINIVNTGTAALEVTGFRLTGPSVFSLVDGLGKWSASAETSGGIEFAEPIIVEAGKNHLMKVEFVPAGPEPAEGEVRLFSNDPVMKGQGSPVSLQGNVGGPCIAVNPNKVDFGGKLIGKLATNEVQILSCGDAPVEITGIKLKEDAAFSADFALDLTALPGVDPGKDQLGDADAPVILGVNESATFAVTFIPDEINAKDENGQPIPDLSMIEIISNTYVPELLVEVRGFGVEVECPTSVIKVQEGEEVIPQTKLHLIGSQSYAATGAIAKYEWSVKQPPGSQSVFLPSNTAPDPTFEANIAGNYVFSLRVWDSENTPSCVDAEYQVIVNPDEAIHIELIWWTENDPDQTDEGPEAGADLDLHFLHQFAMGLDVDKDGAPDGWFDNPFDCFWFNDEPNWASQDPMLDDDPSLDRDDTDGAGPENVNLNLPEEGMEYRIGVHYWNDHGWGPSLTTVRVYIMSVLVFQVTDVELTNHDMWYVATVHWPSGDVKPITGPGGGYHITPNYQHPLFLGDD
jgi:hypothetical protein